MSLAIKPGFWSWTTSWKRVPWLLFLSGLTIIVIAAIVQLAGVKHEAFDWLWVVAIALYVPYYVQSFLELRKMHREWHWKKTEWFVQSVLREQRYINAGDEEGAAREARYRNDLIRPL